MLTRTGTPVISDICYATSDMVMYVLAVISADIHIIKNCKTVTCNKVLLRLLHGVGVNDTYNIRNVL
jgi:hypothetical protein